MMFRFFHRRTRETGLTYIETILGVAIFTMVASSLYVVYQRVIIVMRASQDRISAIALADEQFELVRNLSYANVGTVSGIPNGVIAPVQTLVRGGKRFIATTTVRNIDQPFDGTAGGSPNDLSPADNKLIQIDILCTTCMNFRPMTLSTIIAPKDLEGDSTNGSLFVRVMDASGLPIQGASVHVFNASTTPVVDINDVTSASGMLQIIDAPPSVSSYEISVSKTGYSSERTYGMPTTTNPTKPHATVAVQTVTQITFQIDRTATLNVSSVTPLCIPVPDINFQISGNKLISTSPDVPNYDKYFSTGLAGLLQLNDIEYDTYTLAATGTLFELAGAVPLSPLAIVPGATQNIQLIMVPKDPPSALITVKDGITGLPVSGADVTLELGVSSTTLITGRGFLDQTDWSGGSGQSDIGDVTRYASDDANVDVSGTPGVVQLRSIFGNYQPSAVLESSTFDTGSPSNFYNFTFLPGGQPIETGDSVNFQIATGNSTSSWTYRGPDGTAGTYYNATTTSISAAHNNTRYLRYKMYLSTASSSYTPSVSDAQFTFTTSCTPPGQVIFQNLANGTYDLTVNKSGYTTFTDTVTVAGGLPLWQEKEVSLVP